MKWSSSITLSALTVGSLEWGLFILSLNGYIMPGTIWANVVWASVYVFNATNVKKKIIIKIYIFMYSIMLLINWSASS